jgi:RND family efflux transporter MFP subunit
VHFLLPGKVDACGVKVGDAVEAGQVLCSLDASVVRLEKERAQAALANAERALDSTFLDRQKTLYESGVIGQGDYERVRVEAERGSSLRDDARTALALVEKKLALHVLKAPFRGRIVDVRARAGLPIGPEVPAFVVSSLDGLVLKAEVPAKHWAAVDKGTNFLLKSVASMALSSSLGGENAPRFAVVDKAPSVDLAKQTFDVELLPVGRLPSVGLAPGMLVSGALVVARYEPGLTLPLEALVAWDASTREGEVFVREPESGVVVARKVTTSGASGGRVHLLKGISDDDDVVSPVPPHLAAGDVVFDARHTHDTEGSP